MWNSSFGVYEGKLEYPATLKDVLARLHPIADISLPCFPKSVLSEPSVSQRKPRIFAETQNESNIPSRSVSKDSIRRQPSSRQIEAGFQKSRSTTPQVIIEVGRSSKRSRESTPEPGKRKSRKKSSTSRLRHDDSQVQFEAIAASSPINDVAFDSQLLTDRQKEVRERQDAEAAMFPDIRSSPRPKQKSAQKNMDSNMELPLHRSASKSHSGDSPTARREGTPTPPGPGEYDEFVASSPTPSHVLHGDDNIYTLHSSPPPEIVREVVSNAERVDSSNLLVIEEDMNPSSPSDVFFGDDADITGPIENIDLPSSPPNMENDGAADISYNEYNVTSFPTKFSSEAAETLLDRSAQLDPYAIDNCTISSYESTPRREDAADQTNEQIESSAIEEQILSESQAVSPEETTLITKPIQVEVPELPNVTVEPATPTIDRFARATSEQTPGKYKDVFVDARSSPVSSERGTIEEVFEDAMSSPGKLLKKPVRDSSPLSDLDEASVLRVMGEFDEGSGRPHIPRKEGNQPESTIDSLPANNLPLLSSTERDFAIDHTLVKPSHAAKQDNEAARVSPRPEKQSSSFASLIPETPAPKPSLIVQTSREIVEVVEEDYDPETTIIVEVPANYVQPRRPISKKRASPRKKGTKWAQGITSSPSRKRKLEEASQNGSAVPDSQEALVESKIDILPFSV